MSHTIHNPRRSRLLMLGLGMVLAAMAFFVTASPAHAHDALLGSDPAADSAVDALPAQLTLTFSAPIAPDAGASEVQVTDAAGTSLVDGAPTVQDNVLTQPLSADGAAGAVTVLWKVVSSDGHPISGEFAFTVTGTPEPAPTETTAPTPTETATPTPTAEPAPTETVVPPADEDSTFADVWPWVVFGIVGIAVLGGVVYLLVSRARREKALSPSASNAETDTPADR